MKHGVLILLHPFNGLFSSRNWVSQYQTGKTSLDLNEARDDWVLGWQCHQLDLMQTICTSLHITTRSTPTPHHSVFTGWMLFLTPNQQCQSTEGKKQGIRPHRMHTVQMRLIVTVV